MNTNPTNCPAVEDLAIGDHVSDAQGVHEVMHCFGFRNGDGRPVIALTLRPLGHGEPWVARHPEGDRLTRATDDEVREFHDASRRLAAATALHQLANDIVDQRLPLPEYHISFSAGVLRSRADLDRWAAYLDAEVRGGTPTDRIPGVNGQRPVVDRMVLDIHAQTSPEREPTVTPKPLQVDAAIAAAKALEPKPTGKTADCGCVIEYSPIEDRERVSHDTGCQDWFFTFGSGQVHPESPAINAMGGESLADKYVVIRGTYESARAIMLRFFGRTWCDQYESAEKAGVAQFGLTELARRHWPTPVGEQEHRLGGGAAGEPGACSAVCICGLTYAGFDTHAEAAELIERHVAEATATPTQQAGR